MLCIFFVSENYLSAKNNFLRLLEKNVMVLPVLLAAILDFLRDSWPGLRTWNS